MQTKKGQGFTILGIVFAFIGIMVLSVFTPMEYPILASIQGNASTAGDATTATMVGFIIPIQWLMVLFGPIVWTFIQRGREQNQEGG